MDIMETFVNSCIRINGRYVEWPKKTITLSILRDHKNEIIKIFKEENTTDDETNTVYHAEINTINHLKKIINEKNSLQTANHSTGKSISKTSDEYHLTMFINYSPCGPQHENCCSALYNFFNEMNIVTCDIVFTALHYGGEDSLRELANHPKTKVTLSTFHGTMRGHGLMDGQEIWAEFQKWEVFMHYLWKLYEQMIDDDCRNRDENEFNNLQAILDFDHQRVNSTETIPHQNHQFYSQINPQSSATEPRTSYDNHFINDPNYPQSRYHQNSCNPPYRNRQEAYNSQPFNEQLQNYRPPQQPNNFSPQQPNYRPSQQQPNLRPLRNGQHSNWRQPNSSPYPPY